MYTLPDIKWFRGNFNFCIKIWVTYGKIGNRINLVDGDIDVMIIMILIKIG